MAISTSESADPAQQEHHAWVLLLAARALLDDQSDHAAKVLHYDPSTGEATADCSESMTADLAIDQAGCWLLGTHLPETVAQFLEFYLPVLGSPGDCSRVIAHLGQSVDARIATSSGDAFFVTGSENRKHLHRLRALCHAVVVGAGTVSADDPQLTTRAVSGPNPVRVVIDPNARLLASSVIFTDAKALTLIVHDESADVHTSNLHLNQNVDFVPLPLKGRSESAQLIVQALARRGLTRLFVEGGGITVSRFLQEACLDRLQIAAAPIVVGRGRDALQLPAIDRMVDALKPPYKLYRMGEDVLWDFDVSKQAEARASQVVRRAGASPISLPVFERLA